MSTPLEAAIHLEANEARLDRYLSMIVEDDERLDLLKAIHEEGEAENIVESSPELAAAWLKEFAGVVTILAGNHVAKVAIQRAKAERTS